MTDFYAANAEWYAALVASWQDESEHTVRELLGPLAGGDVVDIAAGVGTGLTVLQALGADRLFAVEPSPSMRAGLMTTIAADQQLIRRTTIISAGVPEALDELPPHWSGAVMLNAIGHLDDDARVTLWTALGQRLRPRARFVLSLQPPATVTALPWTDFGAVQVGERRLRTRGRAEPVDDTHVVWTMEWSLTDHAGAVLETRTARHRWRVLTPTALADEAAAAGMRPVEMGRSDPFYVFERQ